MRLILRDAFFRSASGSANALLKRKVAETWEIFLLVGNKKGWNVFFFFFFVVVVVGNPVKKRVWARYNILFIRKQYMVIIYIYIHRLSIVKLLSMN